MTTLDDLAAQRKTAKIESAGQATLYQVAWRAFKDQADAAMKAAREGDYSLINQLEEEVNLLVQQFTCHGLFLQEQRRVMQDPEEPEAVRMAGLIAAVPGTLPLQRGRVEAGK